MGKLKGKVYFYFHIVHFKGTSVLYLPKCDVFAQVPANTAHLPNIVNHCKHRLLTSSTLPFAFITIAELEACCIPLYRHFASSPQCEGALAFTATTTIIAVITASHYYLLLP